MDSVFVITLRDGRVFKARHVLVGSRHEARWQLIDEHGRVFIGPPFLAGDENPIAVRDLVEEWWRTRCSLGYANETVASVRAKILSMDN